MIDSRRRGWIWMLGLTAAVAGFWVSGVGRAFGPTHEGRVNGRFALHVRNFMDDGFVGSHYLAGWEPYGDIYAQHPPLPHFAQAGISVLIGAGEAQTRMFPTITGLLAIIAAYALVRGLSTRPALSTLTVVLIVSTPLFWIYAPVLWDFPALYLVPVTALPLIRDEEATWQRCAPFALACAVAALSSYIGAAFAGTFWILTLWRRRRGGRNPFKPMVLVAGLAIAVSFGLTLGWQSLAGNSGHLASSVGERAVGGDISVGQFFDRNRAYLAEMYTLPMLLVATLGVRPTWRSQDRRDVVLASAIPALLLIFGFPYGAYNHEYWSYPALIPLTVLCASGIETIAHLPVLVARRRATALVTVALGALLVLAVALGHTVQTRLDRSDAGELARRTGPAPAQTIAWSDLPEARWLSYYWDLPTAVIDVDDPRARDRDVALMRHSIATRWGAGPHDVVDREGDFVLVRLAAVSPPPSSPPR